MVSEGEYIDIIIVKLLNNAGFYDSRQLRRDKEAILVSRFEETSSNTTQLPEIEGTDWKAVARFYMTVQQGMSIQASDGVEYNDLLSIADSAMAAWDDLVKRS
ncbi:hypothetical protein CWE09_01985 [Aliidiomarina minuta]|uniref:Uncharacterized protein n=1 Tax=Aliidiomarina minuta TaxID=880057 RepID=A0A432W679_9GAMM|nr:hypothetical protein CWE09_01985 [Aliidiomarina minuta]